MSNETRAYGLPEPASDGAEVEPQLQALSLLDRSVAEAYCRELWGERQDACAQHGADIPMPTVEVRVDELADLIRLARMPLR